MGSFLFVCVSDSVVLMPARSNRRSCWRRKGKEGRARGGNICLHGSKDWERGEHHHQSSSSWTGCTLQRCEEEALGQICCRDPWPLEKDQSMARYLWHCWGGCQSLWCCSSSSKRSQGKDQLRVPLWWSEHQSKLYCRVLEFPQEPLSSNSSSSRCSCSHKESVQQQIWWCMWFLLAQLWPRP